MVLRALYDYYNRCKSYDPNSVPEFGRGDVAISFIINIEKDGTFFNLEDVREESGKGTLYRLPFNGSHTNAIIPFWFWDNCTYIFGFCDKLCKEYFAKLSDWHIATDEEWNKLKEENPSVNKTDWNDSKNKELKDLEENWEQEILEKWKSSTEFKKHKAFISLCKRIYEETKDIKFKAVCEFYNKNQLKCIWRNEAWKIIRKNPSANITFRVRGDYKVVADNPKLVNYIERDSSKEGVCLVTGAKGKIIRTATNTPINGCKNSASLVTFQKDMGFDSDGKEQCYNAPISYEADFAVSTALKRLISTESHNKFILGDRTYVFFASSDNQEAASVEDAFFGLFTDDQQDNPDAGILSVRKSFASIFSGKETIKSDERFFIIGIAPNVGREAIVFYSEQSLTEFVKNINSHFDDMTLFSALDKTPTYGINGIFKTIFRKYNYGKPKKEGNYPKNLIDAMAKSIFMNLPYPETVYNATLQCIRTEDRTLKNNNNSLKGKDITCAAIIKAYINRRNNQSINKISSKMDINDNHKGYLYGRLFAVLEKIQELSNKDNKYMSNLCARYMNAASTTPAAVFPTILGLSVHHMEKIEFDKTLKDLECEIMSKLNDAFAPQLSLEEQGRFFIGYFHQYQDLHTSSQKENSTK